MKYLLAKKNWQTIRKKIEKTNQVMLFSDYDGTLTPLRRHPSQAKLPLRTKSVLKKLARLPNIKVCIISGRALDQIKKTVGLKNLVYVGNHGLEILWKRHRISIPQANHIRAGVSALCGQLQRLSTKFPGCWVENKGLCVSLHYRRVSPVLQNQLPQEVKAISGSQVGKFVLTSGEKVWEIRPRVKRDKAWAVRYLSRAIRNGSKLGIYLGDDVSDLSALALVQRQGGIAVKIGQESLKTKKFYYLNSSGQVYLFLKRLAGHLTVKAEI